MVSIPSAVPLIKAAPKLPQSPATQEPSDAPNSFAALLKGIAGRAANEPQGSTTIAKLSRGTKDRSGPDKKKEDASKRKISDGTDATVIPIPVLQATPLRFAFPKAQASASTDDLRANELKNNLAQARTNAPVAFGVHLANTPPHAPKADLSTAAPKSAIPNSGKPAGEAGRPIEPNNTSSRHQQQHPDSFQQDQPSASGSTNKSAHIQAEPIAAVHAAASAAPNQIAPAAVAVQSAYMPTATPAISKLTPPAPVAAIPEPAAPSPARPHNIDLKIGGPDNSQVDVRVSQRAGDVQVTVRTANGDLAQSLRQHLPELSDRLSQNGMASDVWQPQPAQAANTGTNDSGARYSDDAQTQQQAQQQQSRDHSHQSGQQQENQSQKPTAWLNELNRAEKETN